jgi:hypothetical protein
MPYLARPFNRIRETVAYKSAGQRCGSSGRNAFVVPFVRRHSFCEWAVAPEPGLDSPGDGLFFGGPFLATLAPIKEGAPMENRISRIAAMALSFAVSVASPAAFAQSSTPVRVGNIWDWQDHQPTQAGTLQNEKVAGIAPSQRQIDANAVAEQQLYRQLLHRSSGG